jgi:hypothetical protein
MTLKSPLGGSQSTVTVTELRDMLLRVFDAMRADAIPLGKAKEMANVAGKIIKSASAQTEYAVARKEKPDIPFLK